MPVFEFYSILFYYLSFITLHFTLFSHFLSSFSVSLDFVFVTCVPPTLTCPDFSWYDCSEDYSSQHLLWWYLYGYALHELVIERQETHSNLENPSDVLFSQPSTSSSQDFSLKQRELNSASACDAGVNWCGCSLWNRKAWRLLFVKKPTLLFDIKHRI